MTNLPTGPSDRTRSTWAGDGPPSEYYVDAAAVRPTSMAAGVIRSAYFHVSGLVLFALATMIATFLAAVGQYYPVTGGGRMTDEFAITALPTTVAAVWTARARGRGRAWRPWAATTVALVIAVFVLMAR